MQVRSGPPAYVWQAFRDPRGDCNIAIYSIPGTQTPTYTPLVAWPAVIEAGNVIAAACLSINQAGTAIVDDMDGKPALGMFIWQDGADFQWLMNHNMGFAVPPGFNPNPPSVELEGLKANVSASEADFKVAAGSLLSVS
ncbi:MAG: hypothetical protein Q9220_005290 [cf. Caloplaca sp. 1 TL-2023]